MTPEEYKYVVIATKYPGQKFERTNYYFLYDWVGVTLVKKNMSKYGDRLVIAKIITPELEREEEETSCGE